MIYQMREKKLCMEFEMEKNNLKKSTTTRIRDLNDEIERLCQEIKQMVCLKYMMMMRVTRQSTNYLLLSILLERIACKGNC